MHISGCLLRHTSVTGAHRLKNAGLIGVNEGILRTALHDTAHTWGGFAQKLMALYLL